MPAQCVGPLLLLRITETGISSFRLFTLQKDTNLRLHEENTLAARHSDTGLKLVERNHCFKTPSENSGSTPEKLQRRTQTKEVRCYCRIPRIFYKDHVTNQEVRAEIQQAIGPHEHLLTTVKRRKLQWYGHFSRSSGLANTILRGTVKGGRRQGGQRRRWEDNIRDWKGLEFGKFQRAVENREKWRKQVAKSSVVPQRPSWLRD